MSADDSRSYQKIKVVTNSFPITRLPTHNYYQYDGESTLPVEFELRMDEYTLISEMVFDFSCSW